VFFGIVAQWLYKTIPSGAIKKPITLIISAIGFQLRGTTRNRTKDTPTELWYLPISQYFWVDKCKRKIEFRKIALLKTSLFKFFSNKMLNFMVFIPLQAR